MSRFGIMKHLGILEEAGLVIARRQGRFRYNHLNAAPLRALQERWLSRQGERAAAIADGIGKVTREESMPDIEKNIAAIAEVALDWTIEAPIQRVWRSLIDGIDSWWPSEHRAGEPGGGGRGGDCVAVPFVTGRGGMLIRAVSRESPGRTRGGKVMRTVSFLGPSESLMAQR